MTSGCKSKVNCVSCFRFSAGVRVSVDGLDLGLTGQPQRLLGVLLAERDQVVSTDLLVERLWPDEARRPPPKSCMCWWAGCGGPSSPTGASG
jgi:DNA-binding winged helix-turn-helix (wHTH) protein